MSYVYAGGVWTRAATEDVPDTVRKLMDNSNLAKIEIDYHSEGLYGGAWWTIKSQLGGRDIRIAE